MSWLDQIFGFLRSFQFWVTIAPWEQALRVRFGRHAKVLPPGVHWRFPFIDRLFVLPIKKRTIASAGQTLTTRDGQSLTINIAVTYAIADIERLYLSVCNPEGTLLYQMQGEIADFVSTMDRAALTSRLIEDEISKKLPAVEWGLSELRLMVTTFSYARPIRLLQAEWQSSSATDQL